jgi:hypothetical protein
VPVVGEYSEQFTVAVPPDVKTTLVGQEDKSDDPEVSVRFILPEKPERLVRLIDSVFEVPAVKDIDEGADMLKSVMVMLRRTLWLREPLVPVIFRL